jgi:hypothetical protein
VGECLRVSQALHCRPRRCTNTLCSIPGLQAKPADFATALHIAQELAVLTPSMQDRALLPSCEVVFGALPREVRAAFRKFTEGKSEEPGQVFEASEVLSALG